MKQTGLLALLLLSAAVTAQAGHGTIRETETQIFIEYYGDAEDNKIANIGPYGPAEQPSTQQVIPARPKASVAAATVKPTTKPYSTLNETPSSTPNTTSDSNPYSNQIATSYSSQDSNPVAIPYSNSNATANAAPRPNQGVQTAQIQGGVGSASSTPEAQSWGSDSDQSSKNQRPPRPGRPPRKGYPPQGESHNAE